MPKTVYEVQDEKRMEQKHMFGSLNLWKLFAPPGIGLMTVVGQCLGAGRKDEGI